MRSMHTNGQTSRRNCRSFCAAGAIVALSILLLPLNVGCEDAVAEEFRSAALSSVETGVNSIMDGILEGIFAIAEPSSSSSSDSSSSSGSSSTSDSSSTDTTTSS